MRQITFKIDEIDHSSLSSLLDKVNSDRVSPINMSCLLRIILTDILGGDRRDYKYVRDVLHKVALRASPAPQEHYDNFVKPEIDRMQTKVRSIESLHADFDACCEAHNITPTAFASWLQEVAPTFNRATAIGWYYEINVPDQPSEQEKFLEIIDTFISAYSR